MQDLKLSIRPKIEIEKSAPSVPEHFQNEVLRPILKLQNDLLLAMFHHFLQKRKIKWESLSRQAQLDWIAQSLRSDLKMRNLLCGTIIGHFTIKEWQIFQEHEVALTKRLIGLITKRLQDQIQEIVR